jgi:hypothetical protein
MSQVFYNGGSGGGGGGGAVTSIVSAFQPNANVQEFDDFVSTFGDNTHSSKMPWEANGSGFLSATPGTNTNPGIMAIENFTPGATSGIFLRQGSNSGPDTGAFASGGGAISNSWVVQLSSLSSGGNTYRFSCGLADGTTLLASTDAYVDGVYFQYTNAVNGGQWTINCTKNSVTTTVNTSVAANTNFVTLTALINTDGTSVSFFINNVLVGTPITTNIPTNPITPFVTAINLTGTNPTFNADLWYINYTLTNPRPGPIFNTVTVGTGQSISKYTAANGNYQVLNTDSIIGQTNTSAPSTITMPNAALVAGQTWTIKDQTGGAAANNITVSGNGANIDNSPTFVININLGAITLYCDGTNFFII